MDKADMKALIEHAKKFSRPYRVSDGDKFRLKDYDPDDTGDLSAKDKPQAREALTEGVKAIAALQDTLYAQDRWAVLLVFQAIDGAGKDSVIKHVMSGINPQGCQVYSFKAPSSEDLDHDYLWRCTRALPERGRIGIFNRSYYEEVVVVRVHPEFLARQKVPEELLKSKDLFKDRYRDIRHFESYLSRNGTLVRKFFLHVSKKEQGQRFLERLEKPEKNWKFSGADLHEREYLGEVPGRVREDDPGDGNRRGTVVRRARRQQVVHADRGRRGDRGCARRAGSRVSTRVEGAATGDRGREKGAGRERPRSPALRRATMKPHRRLCLTLIGSLVCGAVGVTAQQPKIKPSSPEVVAPPQWTRVLKMPDGRTFVTDGGISVDVKIAKPATLPSVVLPPESGKIIADRMGTPHDKEISLGELRTGGFKNSFATPDGIALNGNYVAFLRQTTPAAKMRLRTKGKRDPVVVMVDGQAVAIMMPLAPVSK